jgi:hypothetical protein
MGRIASNQALSTTFTDTGLPAQVWVPPDPNFDHANFYWRTELQPPYAATIATANTVGNSTAEMGGANYAGMIVRILSGTGADQEYTIASNTATTLTLGANVGGATGCNQPLCSGGGGMAFRGHRQDQPGSIRDSERDGCYAAHTG